MTSVMMALIWRSSCWVLICGQRTSPAAPSAHRHTHITFYSEAAKLNSKGTVNDRAGGVVERKVFQQPCTVCVPSTPAGLAERCTSEPPAPEELASQGLNSTLSFMRSYSLILARALSKWITVLPIGAAKNEKQRSGQRGRNGMQELKFKKKKSEAEGSERRR